MTSQTVEKPTVPQGRYGTAIKADATKKLPTRIEVMRSGVWPETSNKGALTITNDDLTEFVNNFKAGIGVPGGAEFGQLPVDFSHDDHKEAAGWITDLTVDGNVLYADIEWTDAGEAALKGGRFKCFSPSFWPACLGEYHDSEDYTKTARNVLVGGGLTNIPFFKDLTAILASNAGNSNDKQNNVNAHKENNTVPTLDEVRIKDVASLTADDKKVLLENHEAGKLLASDKEKFAEVLPAAKVEASQVTGISDEDKAVLASIKSGDKVLVTASEHNSLKASVEKLEADAKVRVETDAKSFVEAQMKEGKIKADQQDKWVSLITADASMKDVLAAIPANEKINASAKGDGQNGDVKSAVTEVREKAAELVKAAKEDDKVLPSYEATAQVLASDEALAQRYDNEVKGIN